MSLGKKWVCLKMGLFIQSFSSLIQSTNHGPSVVTGTGDTKTKRTQTLSPQLDAGDQPPGQWSRKVSSELLQTSVQGSGVSKEVGSLWVEPRRGFPERVARVKAPACGEQAQDLKGWGSPWGLRSPSSQSICFPKYAVQTQKATALWKVHVLGTMLWRELLPVWARATAAGRPPALMREAGYQTDDTPLVQKPPGTREQTVPPNLLWGSVTPIPPLWGRPKGAGRSPWMNPSWKPGSFINWTK